MKLLGDWGAPIPDFVPRPRKLDPVQLAEIKRYDHIALAGPYAYAGHAETKPKLRAQLVTELLGGGLFVEIGPGFGELLRATSGERYAVDQSRVMLERLMDIPGVYLARSLAHKLPFMDVPVLVADSVFQTLPYKERFLCEAARVLKLGGRFIFSVAYRWNYPRRPQQGFDVRDPDQRLVLRRYLQELGFHIETWDWYSLEKEAWVNNFDAGDYLYVVGRKS